MSVFKINSKKLLDLSYIQTLKGLRKKSETSPFTIATNNAKYPGITLTKEVKDLYAKNFKLLKKEIEKISKN